MSSAGIKIEVSDVPELVMTGENLRAVERCSGCGAYIISTPLIECLHCGGIIPVRCFSYRHRSGAYYAECLDLNLLTRGTTEEEAIGRLQEEMYAYCRAVLDGGGDATGLIPRRAPLGSWIYYYARRIKDKLMWRLWRKHPPAQTHYLPKLGVFRPNHC